MAAMAVGSLISSHQQRKAQMQAKVADAKLQRARLERARLRSTEDYVANSQRAREGAQAREIKIEENRLDAESRIDETFAGSGISGTSVSQLENELDAVVEKNKFQNRKSLDQELSGLGRNYRIGTEDINYQSESIDTTPVKTNLLSEAFNVAQGAASGIGVDRSLGLI